MFRPLTNIFPSSSVSYLHEREQKRELRRDVAKKTTDVTTLAYSDQERSLLFTLRSAYVQVLQNKAFLENAKENLDYWDHELRIDKLRFDAGDLAQIDYDRLRLQRIPFESDFETATVNLRTAKIQLLQLLNDRTPIEQFDVNGTYDYSESLMTMDEFRNIALVARPDLLEALQNVELAKTESQTRRRQRFHGPYFWHGYRAAILLLPPTLASTSPSRCASSIATRAKRREPRSISGATNDLADAAQAQVFNDVDSAYVTLEGLLSLLRPYKTEYLKLAADTRDKMSVRLSKRRRHLCSIIWTRKRHIATRGWRT